MILESPSLNSKYGCWIVNGNVFSNKFQALRYASATNQHDVRFYFHDHVWENFDRRQLGKVSLPQLYKERAQQLRDDYDHLVLFYSGGSDSHNILCTFLKNNIKLDEISVSWPKELRDGKFYTPNTLDKSARNAVSEWDFAIKPTLDWLAIHHPEIKINIVDYDITESYFSVENIERSFLEKNILRGHLIGAARASDPSLHRKIAGDKRLKRVGNIFGIEKPMLYRNGNDIYVQFLDSSYEVTTSQHNAKEENRLESFYWTADLPLLPMEQAYQCALYFKANIQARSYLYENIASNVDDIYTRFQRQQDIAKEILYKDTWNTNTFQVGKPNIDRSDWYFYLHEYNEFSTLREKWTQAINNLTSDIDPKFLIKAPTHSIISPIKTKPFYIMSLDK